MVFGFCYRVDSTGAPGQSQETGSSILSSPASLPRSGLSCYLSDDYIDQGNASRRFNRAFEKVKFASHLLKEEIRSVLLRGEGAGAEEASLFNVAGANAPALSWGHLRGARTGLEMGTYPLFARSWIVEHCSIR